MAESLKWGLAMGTDDYERLAFEQLRAASRALSVEGREEHERQAYLFALKAREVDAAELEPI